MGEIFKQEFGLIVARSRKTPTGIKKLRNIGSVWFFPGSKS
jgi:hypothetical protein